MFKQLYIFLAVLVLIQANRPFGEDRKQAINDMIAAGIEAKTAEKLFQIESKTNHAVAKANGDEVKVKKLMDSYNQKKEKLFKKLSKEQLKKIHKFFE